MTGEAGRPPVLRSAYVARGLEEAFDVFTRLIGAWWPLPTHGVFGDSFGAVSFEDGRLVERAVDGRVCVWGEVLVWEPPQRVVLTWHPGRESDDASEIEVRFVEDSGGTRVELEHRGWESFGEDAMLRRRPYVGPGAWGHVLDHFADGAEERPQAVDLSGLAAGYAAFFAEAERGGFAAPPLGEWDASEVVAHVALNDLAMTAVAHAIVDGRRDLAFSNERCQDLEVLDTFVREAGDWGALLARGRAIADTARAATARLGRDRLATTVHCRMLHAGTVVLDEPVHWGRIAVHAQSARHLPAHTGQLRDLRPGAP
jgi:uncharacterized protein YndB with AHSA1/START domain